MKSPLSLALVFFVLAVFPFVVPGPPPTSVGYALVGLMGITGALVLTRARAAYYLGIVAAGIFTICGLVTWLGLFGRKLTLPIDPRVELGLGLYLCFRVALAQRTFGPRPPKRRRLSDDDELDGNEASREAASGGTTSEPERDDARE